MIAVSVSAGKSAGTSFKILFLRTVPTALPSTSPTLDFVHLAFSASKKEVAMFASTWRFRTVISAGWTSEKERVCRWLSSQAHCGKERVLVEESDANAMQEKGDAKRYRQSECEPFDIRGVVRAEPRHHFVRYTLCPVKNLGDRGLDRAMLGISADCRRASPSTALHGQIGLV